MWMWQLRRQQVGQIGDMPENESESVDGVFFRDVLRTGGEASDAHRGQQRCLITTVEPVRSQTARISMTT